jgi:uncharacterized protein YuzE
MFLLRLRHDAATNALRLTLDGVSGEVCERTSLTGMVDVAANGRLVGIELWSGVGETDLARMLKRWTGDPVAGEFVSVDSDGTAYIELTAGGADDTARSSTVLLDIDLNEHSEMLAVSIPRRGTGYEISYPSGNR